MPGETKKERKRVVVEEVGSTPPEEVETERPKSVSSDSPKIEVPPQTEPHTEPGIHEEPKEINKMPAEPPRTGLNPFWIIVPGIFLLGALLGGIVYYQRNISATLTQPTPVPVVTQLPATSPTPAASVDLEKYEVKILNGSGIAGEAGKAKDLLEKEGFTVSSTGNASSYSYTKTVIQAKSDVETEFTGKLNEALSQNYQLDSKIQSLPASSSDEVIVIVGSSKAQ